MIGTVTGMWFSQIFIKSKQLNVLASSTIFPRVPSQCTCGCWKQIDRCIALRRPIWKERSRRTRIAWSRSGPELRGIYWLQFTTLVLMDYCKSRAPNTIIVSLHAGNPQKKKIVHKLHLTAVVLNSVAEYTHRFTWMYEYSTSCITAYMMLARHFLMPSVVSLLENRPSIGFR